MSDNPDALAPESALPTNPEEVAEEAAEEAAEETASEDEAPAEPSE